METMPGPSKKMETMSDPSEIENPPHIKAADQEIYTSSSSTSAADSSATGLGEIDLGLLRMQILISAFPPLLVPAIHLAGTNGKGSVSALLESCFLSAGFRVARYNSPHLLEPRDALRIDGLPPTEGQWEEAVRIVKEIDKERKVGATVFEITTAAAYWLIYNTTTWCKAGVDVMIIECGMGGARDATNVIRADTVLASALTSVGLDHTAFLGETVEEITKEKASIAVQDAALQKA